jgi:hypothetical protein
LTELTAINMNDMPSDRGTDVPPVAGALPVELVDAVVAPAELGPLFWPEGETGGGRWAFKCAHRSFCPDMGIDTFDTPSPTMAAGATHKPSQVQSIEKIDYFPFRGGSFCRFVPMAPAEIGLRAVPRSRLAPERRVPRCMIGTIFTQLGHSNGTPGVGCTSATLPVTSAALSKG